MNFTDLLSTVLIAMSLSADCFAVAICGSMSPKKSNIKPMLRISFAFGLAQTMMLLIGWFIGRSLTDLIAGYDEWAAFVLLAGIGGKMLWEAFHPEKECETRTDITKGLLLLTLALATSIDSLAVGLSFAFIKLNIFTAGLIIGIVAFIITAAGYAVGGRISELLGKRAEAVGGVILIAIGLRIIITHLLGG